MLFKFENFPGGDKLFKLFLAYTWYFLLHSLVDYVIRGVKHPPGGLGTSSQTKVHHTIVRVQPADEVCPGQTRRLGEAAPGPGPHAFPFALHCAARASSKTFCFCFIDGFTNGNRLPDIGNRLEVAKGEGEGEGWSGSLGSADISFYTWNGYTTRSYSRAQGTIFKIL